MSRTRCFVELVDGKISRIFNRYPPKDSGPVLEYPKLEANREIRKQLEERSGGYCELCGERIARFHRHEKIPRSKNGEVSMENCLAICADCHILREDSEHGNRLPKFSKHKFDSEIQ